MNGVQCVPHGSVDGRGQWQNRAGERLQLSEAECLLSMFPAIKRNGKHVMNACACVCRQGKVALEPGLSSLSLKSKDREVEEENQMYLSIYSHLCYVVPCYVTDYTW